MREQIEVLEHHSHLLSVLVDVDVLVCDINFIDINMSRGRLLEQIQGSEEGRLSGSGRSDDDHDVAPVDLKGYIVDRVDRRLLHIVLAKNLKKVLDPDQGLVK